MFVFVLVDEDQARGIDAALIGSPARAMAPYVWPILLARDERLFLNVTNVHGFADLIAPRRRAPAHRAPLHRVNHPITQVLRIWLRHPCWPPPSQQVEPEATRFGNPPEFKPNAARSRKKQESICPAAPEF